MDYTNIKRVEVTPEASSLIETFRAIGYNLETAIADVIDNSISANARNIYLNSEWKGGESVITIQDDGWGMNNDELIQAMRPGAKNPLEDRSEKDLGRFGLGLKTASFSQCRKLIVLSKKKDYAPVYWIWDLDYVSQTSRWELINYPISDEYLHALDNQESGTLVVWTALDRVIAPNISSASDKDKDKFLAQMDKVKQHLAMTFHRFIEEKTIKLHCWQHEIIPWNPFLASEIATQPFPEEFVGNAVMKGYVLPHKCHISDETYKIAEGSKGWVNQQGFYVYRGKRLLLAGDWLGLFKNEPQYHLARIQIDLPNSLDSEWQVDIKKSTARPPILRREQMVKCAQSIRGRAVEVFKHRGKITTIKKKVEFQPLWLPNRRGLKETFVVNRKHILIQDLIAQAQTKPDKAIESLLRFIEETIPSRSVFIRESEGEVPEPFENANLDIIKTQMKRISVAQKTSGKSPEQIKLLLLNIEPFNNFPELIETIDEL